MAKYLCEEDMSTGEYISRDEVLKIFHQCCDNCTSSYNGAMCRACADAGAMDILIDMPAADVQPVVHGYWEDCEIRGTLIQSCSVCGSDCGVLYPYNFCPNCGARMDLKDVAVE